jgi:hypothetical protein
MIVPSFNGVAANHLSLFRHFLSDSFLSLLLSFQACDFDI